MEKCLINTLRKRMYREELQTVQEGFGDGASLGVH